MSTLLNPYLAFTDQAAPAMTFYQEVLGGELNMMTFAEYGMEGDAAKMIMHAQLETPDGLVLMASDRPTEMPQPVPGDTVVLCLNGTDSERLHGFWDRFSDGGEIHTPLERQAWGDEYGDLTDRFGMRWMFNIGNDGEGGGQPQ